MVHEQYTEAWLAVENDDFELAADLFLPVAALTPDILNTVSVLDLNPLLTTEYAEQQCRRYVSIARVFADESNVLPGSGVTFAGSENTDPFDNWIAAARGGAVQQQSTAIRLQLSPNPTHERFVLTSFSSEPAEYRCYDAYGRQVSTGKFRQRTEIETASWPAGMYTVEVRYADNSTATERLVVSH